MNLDDLKKPFPADKISWRVGSVSKDKKKAMVLAYLDARDVMQRLDDVCGIGNWQNKHPHANGKTSCAIGIKIGDEWVWKENGAGDSQVEAEKGAFSDAFKRAAVLWGIGRYLYDVPTVWVEINEYKQIKNPNDPRLAKALEAAGKGIKLANEPEPEEPKPEPVNPLNDDEFWMLKDGIGDSRTISELDAAREKALCVKERMSPDQIAEFGTLVTNRRKALNVPPKTNGATQSYLGA